ncbi:hypothetical protein [Alienimonas sp. DA493]|uniref:hypothetical protein n=1 Tax=Alienimonas sp. DA493 TaxID=3373605 RepID=UPI003753E89D
MPLTVPPPLAPSGSYLTAAVPYLLAGAGSSVVPVYRDGEVLYAAMPAAVTDHKADVAELAGPAIREAVSGVWLSCAPPAPLRSGDRLALPGGEYRVSGYGERPAWRPLAIGTSGSANCVRVGPAEPLDDLLGPPPQKYDPVTDGALADAVSVLLRETLPIGARDDLAVAVRREQECVRRREELASPVCDVAPAGSVAELERRDNSAAEYAVAVAFHAQAEPADADTLAKLRVASNDIVTALQGWEPSAFPGVACYRCERLESPPSPGVFRDVYDVRFRGWREVTR